MRIFIWPSVAKNCHVGPLEVEGFHTLHDTELVELYTLVCVCVCACGCMGVFVGVFVCGCGMLICFVTALGSHEMGRHKLPIIIIIVPVWVILTKMSRSKSNCFVHTWSELWLLLTWNAVSDSGMYLKEKIDACHCCAVSLTLAFSQGC